MALPVLVISLSDAPERRAQASAQLDDAGIPFRFLDALTGEAARQTGAYGSCDERRWVLHTGRQPTAGEIGCFASHREAWRICAQSGTAGLVMEDDFRLLPGFEQALGWVEQRVDEFGFIRLQTETRARKRRVCRCGEFTLWRYVKAPHSMMCYGLSPAVARELLRHSEILCEPVDVFVKRYWAHGRTLYGLTPYTVEESELSRSSCIGGRPKSRKPPAIASSRLLIRAGWLVQRLATAARLEAQDWLRQLSVLVESGIVPARVAEPVNAADLKSVLRKELRVRIPPRAPTKTDT